MKVKSLSLVVYLIIIVAFIGLIGMGFLSLLRFVFQFEYDSWLKLAQFAGIVILAFIILVPISMVGNVLMKEIAPFKKVILVVSELIQFIVFMLLVTQVNNAFAMLIFPNWQAELLFYLFIYLVAITIEYYEETKTKRQATT